MYTYDSIKEEARVIATELVNLLELEPKSIVVIGCSTSEVKGASIGKDSDINLASAIYDGMQPVFSEHGIFIAAQCCEHLNRAIVIPSEAMSIFDTRVNVIPQPKAGGSFASLYYSKLEKPVVIEHIKADAGIDIGETLIGMHLKDVCVPVRLKQRSLGYARINAARTRPKFIGGSRAVYDEKLSKGEVR